MSKKEISSGIVKGRITTVEDLLDAHNLSLDDWIIEKKEINTWESGAKDPDGNLVTRPLFQVKMVLKPRLEEKRLKYIREDVMKDLKKCSPKITKKKYKKSNTKLAEIDIFDLHLGKISWKDETGEHYDLDTACEVYEDAIDYFIDHMKKQNIGRIVLPVGNDFFNTDGSFPYPATTKKTPQQNDGRWQKMFTMGRELLFNNILKLTEIAHVDVVMVPGNHDFEKIFYLGDALEGWFHNNPNVTIDNSPSPRKYYRYGKCLIGYTHGDKEKAINLPMIMATERPLDWGECLYREFHMGHDHRKKEIKYTSTNEAQGVILRYMNSLSKTDAWHHENGFIGAKKSAEMLIWDGDNGLEQQIFFNS